MRVLLIEDEPTTAKAIEMMLATEGFNVYTTDLGEEGLDLGKLYDYDIILLDLNLPDMHGYDVLKKLRVAFCADNGATLPAAMTSDDTKQTVRQAAKWLESAVAMIKEDHPKEILNELAAARTKLTGGDKTDVQIFGWMEIKGGTEIIPAKGGTCI